MSESPSGVFPDVHVDFDVQLIEQHQTEIQRARNGREQRRAVLPSAGQRLFQASSTSLLQADRKTVHDFLSSKRGQLSSFYFFIQPEENVANYNIGSVGNGVTSIVAPFKGAWYLNETPVGSVITSVLVGGTVATGVVVTPNSGANGEDQISWSAPTTGGSIVVAGTVRLRIVARSMRDPIRQTFGKYAEVRSIFDITILELPIA